MKDLVSALLLLVAVVIPVQAAPDELPEDAAKAVHAPTNIVLYSLEPWELPTAKDKTFHGVKVLGQITLENRQARTAITAFETAIAQGHGYTGAHCFDPRHAIRVTANGQAFDFLLCYACGHLSVIHNDKEIARVGAAGSPDGLNAILTAANIPLAKSK